MVSEKLPSAAARIAREHADVWKAYAELGKACSGAGPLDAKTSRLVKLALAVGTGSEGATHSHARRARDEGISADEIMHVALLAIPTLGFPQAVKAMTWISDVTGEGGTSGS